MNLKNDPAGRGSPREVTGHAASDSYFRTGVAIDIKFGIPKYDCCLHGICKLDVDEQDLGGPATLRCGAAKGWLFIPYTGFCLICFDKRSLTEETLKAYFIYHHFELPEVVPFSETLNQRVGRQYSLNPGRYRIQNKVGVYGVLFEVKETKIGEIKK